MSLAWRSPAKAQARRRRAPNLVEDLRAECYEGYWEKVPDFDLLESVKSTNAPDFGLGFRTRDEMVGARFQGFFHAPREGVYRFGLQSDDGSLLFLGDPTCPILKVGATPAPRPVQAVIGEAMRDGAAPQWVSVEGRVTFVARDGKGLGLELSRERDSLWARIADRSE